MNNDNIKQVRDAYLDLLKRSLMDVVHFDKSQFVPLQIIESDDFKISALKRFDLFLRKRGLQIVQNVPMNFEERLQGRGKWPQHAETMSGIDRLNNIQFCVEDTIANNVPGDLIETGVWRGGSTIFMRAILKTYGVTDKTVWVADSFHGLPKPNEEKYPEDKGLDYHKFSELKVSIDDVKNNFSKYGLLDNNIQFLKGWFKDTLPGAPIQKLSVLRLDGDLYESTMDALVHLYPKLSAGGYIIIDDYTCIDACKQAVEVYRNKHGITTEIKKVDWTCVYWKKEQ